MTTTEFSNEFDILYNSITSNMAPGLDEYEKSVFLTRALDDIIKAYFDSKLNKLSKGFDDNERRLIDFSAITKADWISSFTGNAASVLGDCQIANIKDDIMYILNESVIVKRDSKDVRLVVIPLGYRELDRLKSKPYKYPLKSLAWRIINKSPVSTDTNTSVELLVPYSDELQAYYIRYIRRPKAIILTKLSSLLTGLTMDDGSSDTLECELDPILHPEILQRAVELAKAAYEGNLGDLVSLGQTSLTNIGTVTQLAYDNR